MTEKSEAPYIEARGLCHRFPDGTLGLSNINLCLRKGEFVLLAGRNGSGKTLLARHLVGLARPTSGTILFRGIPLQSCLKLARQKVAYVFQDADNQILGQTVEEELRLGPENAKIPEGEIHFRVQRVVRLLGLEGNLFTPPSQLSGGEKRKLSIGGILTLEPDILILDEPFANLDYPGVVSVLRLLVELQTKGTGIVLITHELEKALAHASRIVIMADGAIVEDGPAREVAPKAAQYGLHPLDFSRTPLETCTWLSP